MSSQRKKFTEAFKQVRDGAGSPPDCTSSIRNRWTTLPLNQRAFELAGISCIMCRTALTTTAPDLIPMQTNPIQSPYSSSIPRPTPDGNANPKTRRYILAR